MVELFVSYKFRSRINRSGFYKTPDLSYSLKCLDSMKIVMFDAFKVFKDSDKIDFEGD